MIVDSLDQDCLRDDISETRYIFRAGLVEHRRSFIDERQLGLKAQLPLAA
jgi:hypothetical protein